MSGEEAAEDFEENLLMMLGLSKGQLILLNIQAERVRIGGYPEKMIRLKNISTISTRVGCSCQNFRCCKAELFCHMTKLWLMAVVISEYDFDIYFDDHAPKETRIWTRIKIGHRY